jgi:23S rRNA (adenine2030-N6)-methyltransferase
MNYRHIFHAGNFADVFKHAILTRILLYLSEKPQPYRVIDTHAGAGLYDLTGTLANRTGEWRDGIGRLISESGLPAGSELLKPLLDAVTAHNRSEDLRSGKLRTYPGSPAIALSVMRPQDRLTACELEPHAAAALVRNLKGDKRAKSVEIDGFSALKAYLPPAERRGLVLIDPPFEDKEEFDRLVTMIEVTQQKWPTGVYAIWYPVKDAAAPAFVKNVRRLGIPKVLRVELHVTAPQSDRLTACGLLVINPPWRLADELAQLMPELVKLLRREGGGARSLVEPLT